MFAILLIYLIPSENEFSKLNETKMPQAAFKRMNTILIYLPFVINLIHLITEVYFTSFNENLYT